MAHARDVYGVFEQVVEGSAGVVVVLGLGVKRIVCALLAFATLVAYQYVE